MQKINILEPLVSQEETILGQPKNPDRSLIWKRSLPTDVQENVDRLTCDRDYRHFMGALHGVWLKADLEKGEIILRKEGWRAPGTRWWQKKITFSQLFKQQNAEPLTRDLEKRLQHAFEFMSVTHLNMRFFTRLAKYKIISPHKFHTDTIYVMVLNYAPPCTEFTCSHSLSPVESLPAGSVSIMPPGQIHRSPAYSKGVTPFFVAVF